MTEFLYVTADCIGIESGGGAVTENESRALCELGRTRVLSYADAPSPWGADEAASRWLIAQPEIKPRLAHFYAGTFTKTIEILKSRKCVVVYTAAAHDVKISREEHQKLGWPFDYPHLNDPQLWAQYVRGYLLADVVVCPSSLSAACMTSYGCQNIEIVPHGVNLPSEVVPPPKRFHVAYLGQPGADKGIVYLLQAWAKLDYKDAMLTVAGRGTEQLLPLVRQRGGGNVYLRGWVEHPADVYRACSLYVQPSASEGFGIEVLEAMAHGRPVACSAGAGAADVCSTVIRSRDALALAEAIDQYRKNPGRIIEEGKTSRDIAARHAWPIIRTKYATLWRSLCT